MIKEIDIQFDSEKPFFLTKSIVNKLLIQNEVSIEKQAKSVIDLYELEKQILNHSHVKDVSLYMTIDGQLITLIEQRQPIARIMTSPASYYIDSELVKLPLSENYSARVPLVTGVKSDKDLIEVKYVLLKIIQDDFLQKEIVGIHLDPNMECMMTVRSGNYKIEFGKLVETDHKINKLKAFYKKIFIDSMIHKYKTINIKYHNQVVGVK